MNSFKAIRILPPPRGWGRLHSDHVANPSATDSSDVAQRVRCLRRLDSVMSESEPLRTEDAREDSSAKIWRDAQW